MRKYLIIVLVLMCLTLVGCGKKEEKTEDYNVLTCVAKDDEGELTIKVYQDKKTYEFAKVEMSDVVPKSVIEEYGYTEENFFQIACDNENYSNCSFKADGDNYVGHYNYNPEAFAQDILDDEDYQIDKIDKNTFSTIVKVESNSEGTTCTIS